MTRHVALIPLRGGSRGFPGKNVRPLAGRPLWWHAVEQARLAGMDEIVITTDIEEVLSVTGEPGLTLLERPETLARHDTPMAPVVVDALKRAVSGSATCVLLQATSPLRVAGDIEECLSRHATGEFDLVKTVTETDAGVLKYGRLEEGAFRPLADPSFCFSNRQSLPSVYKPNGAVYVFDRDWFLSNGGFVTDRIGAVIMPPERSFDIDTEADFALIEAALAD